MELTTRGRYAVMALAEMVRQGASGPDAKSVSLPAIADGQGLPLAYLEQLFGALRRAKLVISNRGRSGGYRLARPAIRITVADVMGAVDEATAFTRCTDDSKGCTAGGRCITHELWQALGDETGRFLNAVSLQDLIDGRFPQSRQAGAAEAPRDVGQTLAHHAVREPAGGRIYLDHNATSPLRAASRQAMTRTFDVVGNPSSVHGEGRAARRLLETARDSVAALAGCQPSEVVFTSGASEAVAWVMAQPWQAILTTPVEHDCVLSTADAAGCEVRIVAVDGNGIIDVAALDRELEALGGGDDVLVSVQAANNETGIVQPLSAIAEIARNHGVRIHCDAAQAPGRLALDFAALNIDLMSVSAHKFGGPKGVGALIVRDHYDLVPLLRGGGQERRRRAGTENLIGIAGFAAAADVAAADLADAPRLAALRDHLEAAVKAVVPDTIVIGEGVERLCNTSALALPGRLAETLVIMLDLAGFAVSAGSACSSGKVGSSHVLAAMGVPEATAKSAVRVSLGPETTEGEIAAFVEAWRTIGKRSALAA